jgi:hypothetical protein
MAQMCVKPVKLLALLVQRTLAAIHVSMELIIQGLLA